MIDNHTLLFGYYARERLVMTLRHALSSILQVAALVFLLTGTATATFSIVAVDTTNGAVGGAGASCISGSVIINSLHESIGAIHTQAFYLEGNQDNADSLMELGLTPDSIISWLANNDVQGLPGLRQYGVVTLAGPGASAGYTGVDNTDYAGHVTGPGYSIQGNILLGPEIIDTMETMFLLTDGPLEEKLMAALEAADIPGADTRCLDCDKPAISAFIRVRLPGDGTFIYLSEYVQNTTCEVNPIPILRQKYDAWKAEHIADADSCELTVDRTELLANGSSTSTFTMTMRNSAGEPVEKGISFEFSGSGLGTFGPVSHIGGGVYSADLTAPSTPGSETITVTAICVGEPIELTYKPNMTYVACGDVNASSGTDIDDIVYLIQYVFAGGPDPIPTEAGDVNCSGGVDIDDIVYLISHVFQGGNMPCDPDGDMIPDC